ncbi:hydrogenase-4 component F [Raineyella antarctica]|uniref:Hydrogenase-4 component F n=1 Tax=Raineyella antarctica TaxID=1577474 RepID=A0A1G6GFB3_9ACTN|nr:proton-conducting transporter membrane subunit [Raineyella antarctica]SDB80523.1 hydrogenase-4 component F [Raineyella antarctica]
MAALIWIALALPLLLAALSFLLRRHSWTLWLPVAAAATLLVVGVALVVAVHLGGPLSTGAGLLRVDALSAWMLSVVGAVAVIALWAGIPHRADRQRSIGLFATLLALFLTAMALAVVADNLGLLWVAIELTTITTAFLVGYRGGRGALEAAWKYVVLGSVGIAIAFLGIVLLYAASRGTGEPSLSWLGLLESAARLDPALTRAAGALTVLGFATKVGLAPMHSWLPDAQSQAPAPVSGLMSGVLEAVALYAILRVQAITDAAIGPELVRGMLVTAGLLSLGVAAAMSLTQKDYRRLLAYSSMEHMGLLALGVAAGGPLALAAVLLHMLGHGLAKSTMFVLAGRVLGTVGGHRISDVRNLLRRRPDLGAPFLLGAAALLGFPPFVTFFTEVAILVAGFGRGLGWQMALAGVLLLAMFAGFARHVLAMTVGSDPDPVTPDPEALMPDRPTVFRQVPVVIALGLSAVLAFAAWPLVGVLTDAVAALGGTR